MIFSIIKKIIFVFIFTVISVAQGDENKSNRIEVLVNEHAITKYDILQRMKINSVLKRKEINENNYTQLINSVIDDLVVEKLKIKKINEYNINYDNDEFKNYKTRFYSGVNYEEDELKEIFNLNNINYNDLYELMGIEFKWQKLIYGLYLRVTSVTEQEIADIMSKNPNISKEIASDIILQKQLDIKSAKLIKDLRDEATIEYK